MSTLLQKRLAENIVKAAKSKQKITKKDLLVSAGYDVTTAEATPDRIVQQKGVKKELKILGFTEDNAKRVVSKILNSDKVDPNTRIAAAREIFKVHGSYAAEKSFSVSTNLTADELKDVIAGDLQKFRQS